jgi:LPS sulfotransferase NodH
MPGPKPPARRSAAQTSAPHFVVMSLPRSGSIMLGRMLQQHPQLRCFGEIFSTKPVHLAARAFAGAPLTAAERLAYFGAQAAPLRWGFRAHVYHGTPAYDAGLFTDFWSALPPAVRVVHLVRENLFHRYVSHRVARLTDQWFVRPGEEASVRRVTLRLSPREVAENCEEMASWQAAGRARFPRALTVRYEDLERDSARRIGEVLRHLGVDDAIALEPATVRLFRPIRETVENYDELKRYFAGSRWERFFVD